MDDKQRHERLKCYLEPMVGGVIKSVGVFGDGVPFFVVEKRGAAYTVEVWRSQRRPQLIEKTAESPALRAAAVEMLRALTEDSGFTEEVEAAAIRDQGEDQIGQPLTAMRRLRAALRLRKHNHGTRAGRS